MKALFLGSISVLADTTEIQREAFNLAFHEAGLDWHWSQEHYRDMLEDGSDRDRIAAYAKEQGDEVDVAKLQAHKTKLFKRMLKDSPPPLRPETDKLLTTAREEGQTVALVSGASKDSLDALLDAYGGAAALGISLVTSDRNDLAPKPDPALYEYALKELGLSAQDVQAVEDNRPGYDAATAAGISCLVYPNSNTRGHDFGDATRLRDVDDDLVA